MISSPDVMRRVRTFAQDAELDYMGYVGFLDRRSADYALIHDRASHDQACHRSFIAYRAAIAEHADPEPKPVICHVCGGESLCNWTIHLLRKRPV